MKPKTYSILERAVEEGASYAWRSRIFKYQENPSEESAIETIRECVMLAISEVFDFEQE
jgi:hypothetical protein